MPTPGKVQAGSLKSLNVFLDSLVVPSVTFRHLVKEASEENKKPGSYFEVSVLAQEIGEESDIFFFSPPVASAHPLSRLSVKSRPVVPFRHLPSDPRAPPGGPSCHRRLKWNLPLGALRVSPPRGRGVSALRSGPGGGMPGEGSLGSDPGTPLSLETPGRASQVRGRRGWRGVAWRGVGSWRAGGRRVGTPPLPSLPSDPSLGRATSLLTHNVCRASRGRAGAAARPLGRCPAARPSASGSAHTLPPVRPGPLSPAPRSTATAPHVAVGPPAPPAARPRQPCLSGAACAAGAGSPCLTPAGQAGR